MAPKFVDLFCGIGGFRIGLESAGFECVYANDNQTSSVETYDQNRRRDAKDKPAYKDYTTDTRDIRHVRIDEIPDHDLLAAGFPCNAYSPLGRQLGADDPNFGDIPAHILKIVDVKRPLVVLLENVKNFFIGKRQDGEETGIHYNTFKQGLENIGYACAFQLLKASHFGLPQNRTRGFIVAVRRDVDGKAFEFPASPTLADASGVNVRSVLLDPQSALLQDLTFQERGTPKDVDIKSRATAGPRGYNLADIIDQPPKPTYHGTIRIGQVAGYGPRQLESYVYHDLGLYPTVVGQYSRRPWVLTRGRDDAITLRKLHLQEVRRLQGFPEGFGLHGATGKAHRQLAQAVPPVMVSFLAKAIKARYADAFRGKLPGAVGVKSSRKRSLPDDGGSQMAAAKISRKSLDTWRSRRLAPAKRSDRINLVRADAATARKNASKKLSEQAVTPNDGGKATPKTEGPVFGGATPLVASIDMLPNVPVHNKHDGATLPEDGSELLESEKAIFWPYKDHASAAIVQQALDSHRMPWADEEEATLRRMIKGGASYKVIAPALGRTEWAISTRWNIMRREGRDDRV